MKKLVLISKVLVLSLVMASCTRVYPGMVTTAASVKEGIAKKKVWFGIAMNVDVSLATAAKNGGITKIATVDYGVKGGLFSKTYFVKVTGE
ncbi:MAG: hypothetical protein IT236_14795 [Bacteroidia bacterium]|nr:hypothetical protein [Bacteroidia bacterium]